MNNHWLSDAASHLPFQTLDYLVIGLNLFIFLFAKQIIKSYPQTSSESTAHNRMLALRVINLVLFLIYTATGLVKFFFFIEVAHLQEISQTGLTVLVSYIVLHYIQSWIIVRFGKSKEIDGEKIKGESYASEMIGLLALILVSSIAFLVIINIWSLNDWLQATSVIGGVLLILFASKDYFLGDMINGLIMHYNHSVEAGSVIRVKELNITGVVLQITLSQTIIRDLLQRHEISIPNSRLRNATVETISNCTKQGFRDFVDFNIGYEQSPEKVKQFLESVFLSAHQQESAITASAKPKIVVIENGDHAVTWRLLYFVNNPYRLLDAKNTLHTIAFELSRKRQIGLNTPVTHHILKPGINRALDHD